MILKYETEKGFGYKESMTDVIVDRVKYSNLMIHNEELVKKAETSSSYMNSYLYWSIKKHTNVDYVDFSISPKYQEGIEGGDYVNLIYYSDSAEKMVSRVLVFIGTGYLLNNEGTTIETIR